MTHFIRNTQVKAMTSIWMAKQKARELQAARRRRWQTVRGRAPLMWRSRC